MDCLNSSKFLAFLMFLHVTYGQTVTLTGPTIVQQGTNTILTCNVNGGTATQFVWIDNSVTPAATIYSGGNRFSVNSKYTNFQLTSETDTSSRMTIEDTATEDEGEYSCTIPTDENGNTIDLMVEVLSARSLTLSSTDENNEDKYIATCEATGGKPMETITWILNGVTQSDGNGNTIETTNPQATSPLSNTRSVFTFPATIENYQDSLVCNISGHQLTELNGQESQLLDIHTSPSTAGTIVTVGYVPQGSAITVSCGAENQPNPTMRNYFLYSNGSLIHDPTGGGNQVTVSDPVAGTEYTCMAGNYLGNTSLSEPSIYEPARTTTPPPTTDPTTPNVGAIVGGVVGGIALIIIVVLVIKFVVKPECMGGSGFSFQALFACCKCSLPSNSGGSRKKPASSAVGSSNGSEKDKIKPSAAPRTQSSIQHTTDNPEQAEYAMVDRKPGGGGKGGGDMPDKGYGAGQNEPAGMVYADLDLSAKAGHTEKQIPQNKDDVVVYSSILV